MTATTKFGKQPQGPVRLSARASQDKCVAAVLFASRGLNAANGQPAVSLGATNSFVSSPYGTALRGTSAVGGLGLTQGSFSDLIPVAESFTVMTLVRVETLGSRRFVMGDYNSAGSAVSYNLFKASGNGFTSGNLTTPAVGLGWHWVEDVHDRSGATSHAIYVDGVMGDANAAQTRVDAGAGKFRIGSSGEYTSESFDGDMAVCLIFKKALSPSERKAYRENPNLAFAAIEVPIFATIDYAKIRGPKTRQTARTSQPQTVTGVNPAHPMGQNWALVHVPGVMLFGDADPVGALRTNTGFGIGAGGKSLIQSGSAANSGLDFGANPTLLLNTLSGIGVAKCINAAGYSPFITTAFRAISPAGGFLIDIGLGKVRLAHGDVALLLESSNAVPQGELARFAWSYNASTGRVRIALNGVLTTGIAPATLSHVAFSEGGYYTDNALGSAPSEHYLLAISTSEQFNDAALISASLNPWQLFAPVETPVWLTEGVSDGVYVPADTSVASDATVTASATAALTTAIKLTATASAVSTLTATLSTGGAAAALDAAPAALASATAALTTSIKLAAAPVGQATATATLTSSIKLVAAPAGQASATAALTTSVRLVAAPAALATATAAVTTAIKLAAAPAALASATAALTTVPAGMNSSASAQASATASLSSAIRLVASPAALASATASVTTAIKLSAGAAAQAASTAAITTAIKLVAAPAGQATATAALTAPGSGSSLDAAPAAEASATAALTTAIKLSSSAQVQATATAALTTVIRLAAAPAAQASSSSDLTATGALWAASPAASATATASLTTGIKMTAAASSAASATASLLTAIKLSSSAQVQATGTSALTATGAVWTAAMVAQSIAAANLTTKIILSAQASSSASGTAFLTVNAAPPFVPSLSTAHWVAKRKARNWVVAGE